MPCYHPLTAYQYLNSEHGLQPMFNRPYDHPYKQIQLPDNHCTGCRMDHGIEWGIRAWHECQMHTENMFLTCRHSDENMESDFGVHRDVSQKFIKRLEKYIKKHHPGIKIKYLGCGEYGENTYRAHYHFIVCGFRFKDEIPYFQENKKQYTTSEIADNIWNLGDVTITTATAEDCFYVARYMLKDIRTDDWKTNYQITDPETGELYLRNPPFFTKSNQLGKSWYDKYKTDCFPAGFIINKGTKMPVPGYYLYLLKKEDPEQYEKQMTIRREALTNPQYKWNSTPDRLAVREKCHQAKSKDKKRDKV